MAVRSFSKSKALGAWAGEQVMEAYRAAQHAVVDVQDDPFYQSLDVDLLVSGRYGPVTFAGVEVKADTYKTGNVYLELVSCVELDTPGCVTYMQAEQLVYYFVAQGKALVLPVAELQAWIAAHAADYPPKTVKGMGRVGPITSTGIAAPARTLLAEIPGAWWWTGLPLYEEQA